MTKFETPWIAMIALFTATSSIPRILWSFRQPKESALRWRLEKGRLKMQRESNPDTKAKLAFRGIRAVWSA